MNNRNLADRIKELRTRKGFSQEQLSEDSKLSLRTIQRIEKGESVPRGDTLMKLTQALGVTPDDILDWEIPEDRGYLILLNVSALSMMLHPLLGIIIPLVMWVLKREKINRVDDSGKKLINFQITWSLTFYLFMIVISKGRYLVLDYDFLRTFPMAVREFTKGGFFVVFLYLYNLTLIFVNTRRNYRGMGSRYLTSIPFLR